MKVESFGSIDLSTVTGVFINGAQDWDWVAPQTMTWTAYNEMVSYIRYGTESTVHLEVEAVQAVMQA